MEKYDGWLVEQHLDAHGIEGRAGIASEVRNIAPLVALAHVQWALELWHVAVCAQSLVDAWVVGGAGVGVGRTGCLHRCRTGRSSGF